MSRMSKYWPWSLVLFTVTVAVSATIPLKMANAEHDADCVITDGTDRIKANGVCLKNNANLISQAMNAESFLERARQLAIGGKYQEAIIEVTQAITLKPDYIEAYCYRTSLFIMVDKPELAIADAEKAVELFNAQGEPAKAQVMLDLADDTREGIKAGDLN
jgi:tetratricopeptide (TPR) repeat protein